MSEQLYLTERLREYLSTILSAQEATVSQLEALRDAVARNRDVTRSAVQLLQGLADKLKEVRSPEDLSAIIAEVEADSNELASAVAANTSANQFEPHPPPAPVEPSGGSEHVTQAEEAQVPSVPDTVSQQQVQEPVAPPSDQSDAPTPPVEPYPSQE